MKKIAVLYGGTTSEREVSLDSGRNVAEALASTGRYDVKSVILDSDGIDALPDDVDAVYIALHGGWGEDGGVQAALDARGVPYTGPGAEASAIAMDKVKTKLVLEMKGVPVPKWSLASAGAENPPLPPPLVVKPPRDGSSVGISKVSDRSEWAKALETAMRSTGGSEALVEEYIPGREATVGIVDGVALPPIEIVAKNGWYGYDEKYNSNETRYPVLEDEALCAKLEKTALDAWSASGCRGVARVDFRISPLGRIYVLELNTSPGMTAHSLVPKAAAAAGVSFPDLCARILEAARCDKVSSPCSGGRAEA